MAHIVIVTSGLTGLFHASLALIAQLKAAGHRVTYASPGDLAQPLADLQIPFVLLPPWQFPAEPQPQLSTWQKWRRIKSRQRQAVRTLGLEQFTRAMVSLSPDLLLIDIEMHPQIMVAVSQQFRVALLCPFFSIWRRAGVPPLHVDTSPGEGWHGQWWGMQWSWLRYSWSKRIDALRDRWQKQGLDWRSILRRTAIEIDYPFKNTFGFSHWLSPYPHDATLPVLCLHAEVLDLPHRAQPTVHYMGPMVCDTLFAQGEMSADLLTFLQKRQGEKLIYCGASTFSSVSQSLLRSIIALASLCPSWDFVVSLGGASAFEQLANDSLPANLCVLSWVPQLALLQRADCAIINGGPHTITECVHYEVPMLVVPMSKDDQRGNAVRAAYHGLGIVRSLESCCEQTLLGDVKALLGEPAYRKNLARMKQSFQRYSTVGTVAHIIKSLLLIDGGLSPPNALLQVVTLPDANLNAKSSPESNIQSSDIYES
ncbi:MAG: glycosyltransferase [Cyanobacteria bacterium J06627_28]